MSLVRGVRICPKNVQRSWTGPNHSLNVPALDLQRECVQKCLAAFSEENSAELEDTTAAFWAATANLGFDSESLKVLLGRIATRMTSLKRFLRKHGLILRMVLRLRRTRDGEEAGRKRKRMCAPDWMGGQELTKRQAKHARSLGLSAKDVGRRFCWETVLA